MPLSKGLTGAPGPGGSLGQCGVCGDDFLSEIFLGEPVRIRGLEGMDKDFCVHEACDAIIEHVNKSKNWKDLPPGPLRKMFEKHEVAVWAEELLKEFKENLC